MDTYRRRSIFWPLTLIAVGVLFLYPKFDPAVHPWQLIAKFWPVLIIIWGLSKLVEHLSAPAGTSAFSASEVVLLVLILIFGTMLSAVVLHSGKRHWWMMDHGMDQLFTNSYTYSQTLTEPAKTPLQLVLTDAWGDVDVRASDKPEIFAVVKETVTADDHKKADAIAKQIHLNFVESSGVETFQTNLDQLPDSGNVRLDLTIRVPAETKAQITAERGDLVIAGLTGAQSLSDKHGDVRVSDLHGSLQIQKSGGSTQLSNVSGSVDLKGHGEDVIVSGVTGAMSINGDFSGAMQFQKMTQTLHFTSSRTDLTAASVSGRLDMDMGSLDANGVGGPFELTTRDKDVRLENFTGDANITDTNGDVHLRPASPVKSPVKVNLKNGNIEMDLPPSSAFAIDALARGGDVASDFFGPDLQVSKHGSEPSIRGSIGAGGPTLRLRTTYGTIRLSRKEPSVPAASGKGSVSWNVRPMRPVSFIHYDSN